MDKITWKNILEIIYNCPFILLVIATSLVFVFLFDGNGERRDVKNVAVFRQETEGNRVKKEDDNLFEEDEITADKTRDIDGDANVKLSENRKTGEEPLQNEGTCKEEKNEIKKDNVQKTKLMNGTENEKLQDRVKHTTKFVEYTPIETNSRYYSDAGKIALTTEYDYVLENESYFNDAAFLGDSRTLGISDYAGLDGADFFCDNGMTIYKLLGDDGVTYQKTGEKVDLKEMLQEKQYGKIYIMLGMNELGYGDTPMYLQQYFKVIRQIREWQPGVIIYVMANLHVSQEKNNMESEFNNININDKNVASARLANGKDIFYLDCNPLFTDGGGYLQAELTFDGVHLYAQHYDKWRDFLFAHGVEKEGGS